MGPNNTDGMTNSVDFDQKEQSDLGLHCLHRPVCRKTLDYASIQTDSLKKQSDQGLHFLPFHLHVLHALLNAKTNRSNFRIITANFWGITIFQIFLGY